MMQVSGVVMRSRYLFIRSRGEQALQQVLEALPQTTRNIIDDGFLETRWYPMELMLELSETADRVLGNGDLALCYEMGRYSCEHNLTTTYRLLFKFGNLDWLLQRATKAWSQQYDQGQLVAEHDEEDRIVVELRNVPTAYRAHCLAVGGWMARAAELNGEDKFEIVETCRACGDPRCRWRFQRHR